MKPKSTHLREKYVKCFFLAILPVLLWWAARAYLFWLAPKILPCFLRTFTGLRCPSCGMTHSAAALMRLDIFTALRENAAMPVLAMLGLLWYAECWGHLAGKKRNLLPRHGGFWIGLAVVWVLYSILRNFFR